MNLYAGYHPSASVTPLDRVPVTIDPQTFHERYVLARRPCVVVGLPSPSIDPHFQLDTSIMSMRPTTGGDAIARQEPPRKRQRHKYDNDAVPQSLSLIDHWLSSNPAFANAVVQVEQRSMRTGTFGTADRAKLRMTVGDLVQRLREGVHATMGDGDATNDDAPYYLTTQYVDEENGRDVSRALAAVDEFVLRGRELNSRVCGNGAAVKGDNGDHNNDHKSRRPSRQARDSNTGTMDETMDDDDELKHRLLDLWPPPILQALREVLPLRPHLLRELVPQQINLWLGASRSGTSSGLHHDFHDNLYMLLQGCKRFVLFSPRDASSMYLNGTVHTVHPNGLIVYYRDPPALHDAERTCSLSLSSSSSSSSSAVPVPPSSDEACFIRADGADRRDVAKWRYTRARTRYEAVARALAAGAQRGKGKERYPFELVDRLAGELQAALEEMNAAEAEEHVVLGEDSEEEDEAEEEDGDDEAASLNSSEAELVRDLDSMDGSDVKDLLEHMYESDDIEGDEEEEDNVSSGDGSIASGECTGDSASDTDLDPVQLALLLQSESDDDEETIRARAELKAIMHEDFEEDSGDELNDDNVDDSGDVATSADEILLEGVSVQNDLPDVNFPEEDACAVYITTDVDDSSADDIDWNAPDDFDAVSLSSCDEPSSRAGVQTGKDLASRKEPPSEPPSFSRIPVDVLHAHALPTSKSSTTRSKAQVMLDRDFALLRNATPVVVELQAGEMLYLPASWFHEVTSMGEGKDDPVHMALSYWMHPPGVCRDNGGDEAAYVDDFWLDRLQEALTLVQRHNINVDDEETTCSSSDSSEEAGAR